MNRFYITQHCTDAAAHSRNTACSRCVCCNTATAVQLLCDLKVRRTFHYYQMPCHVRHHTQIPDTGSASPFERAKAQEQLARAAPQLPHPQLQQQPHTDGCSLQPRPASCPSARANQWPCTKCLQHGNIAIARNPGCCHATPPPGQRHVVITCSGMLSEHAGQPGSDHHARQCPATGAQNNPLHTTNQASNQPSNQAT